MCFDHDESAEFSSSKSVIKGLIKCEQQYSL